MAGTFSLRRLWSGVVLAVGALTTLQANADLLSPEEQLERLSVLGQDFIVAPIEAPVIEDVSAWVDRVPGSYVYRVVSDSAEGTRLQTEQHVPLDGAEMDSWQRVVEDRLVETFVAEEGRDVLIVEEVDHHHGFRLVMEPAIHLPRTIAPGQEWEIDSSITAFRIEDGSMVREGQLKALHSYEGAYRVRCPAGEFDAILIREDFQIHIGPLKAEDDRLLLFAKGVGLVAEVEGIKASALFVFHLHEDSAKMLEQYPDTVLPVMTGAQ